MDKFIVKEATKERLDKYLSNNSEISRNSIKELIENGKVEVNGKIIDKPKHTIKENDVIIILERIVHEVDIKPEDIKLDIIYEDKDLLVVNKPSGMVTHPAPGHYSGTLVNALMHHYKKNLSSINGVERPGIVHRLDKDTSGLLLVAKNNKTHTFLSEQLKDHKVNREYIAIVEGQMKNKITHIDLPVGRDINNRKKMAVRHYRAKEAMTHVYVQEMLPNHTIVRCVLETGRTHQIRVHLAYIKHPVYNDPQYSTKAKDAFGQYLHAYKLSFTHPNGEMMTFEAPLPEKFKAKIQELKSS